MPVQRFLILTINPQNPAPERFRYQRDFDSNIPAPHGTSTSSQNNCTYHLPVFQLHRSKSLSVTCCAYVVWPAYSKNIWHNWYMIGAVLYRTLCWNLCFYSNPRKYRIKSSASEREIQRQTASTCPGTPSAAFLVFHVLLHSLCCNIFLNCYSRI